MKYEWTAAGFIPAALTQSEDPGLNYFDVTIAGELNLDLILYGLPEQLEPERELLASDLNITLGSSSAIVAHNLARLGNRVGFISKIGDDEFGEAALDRLRAAGADVSKVFKVTDEPNTKTGLTVILHHPAWRNILTFPGTIFDLRLQDLDLEYLSSSRHFHLSSFYLQKSLCPDIPRLLQRLRNNGVTISLDCNDDPDDRWDGIIMEALRYVDVFLPNAREAMKVARMDDLAAAMERLSQIVPVLVVKLGAEGARARRGKEDLFSPGIEVNVVDTVGAGDSFDAGFIHEFIRGCDLKTCLRAGNLAGALSTTRPGGIEAFRDSKHRQSFYKKMLRSNRRKIS
jgi:sugar/nucleoside kinase (ribokinase family)